MPAEAKAHRPDALDPADQRIPTSIVDRSIFGEEKVKTPPARSRRKAWKHDWRPIVWLGNDAPRDRVVRGELARLAHRDRTSIERDRGRELRRRRDAERPFRRDAPAKPLVLDKPREIVFGLMFTPPRPFNPKSRSATGSGCTATSGSTSSTPRSPRA